MTFYQELQLNQEGSKADVYKRQGVPWKRLERMKSYAPLKSLSAPLLQARQLFSMKESMCLAAEQL